MKANDLFVSDSYRFVSNGYMCTQGGDIVGRWRYDCANRTIIVLLMMVSATEWIPSRSATVEYEKWLAKEVTRD